LRGRCFLLIGPVILIGAGIPILVVVVVILILVRFLFDLA
jgi:hypothetical protein